MDHLIITNFKNVEGLTCDISAPSEKLAQLYKQKADLLDRIERYESVRIVSTKVNEIAPIIIDYFKNHPKLNHIKFVNIRVVEPCDQQPHFIFTHNAGEFIADSLLLDLEKEFKKLGNNFDYKFFPPRLIFSGRNSLHLTMDQKPF